MKDVAKTPAVAGMSVSRTFQNTLAWQKRPSLTSHSPKTRRMKSRFLQ